MVDRESVERDTKGLTTRLKFAALRQTTCVEVVNLLPMRQRPRRLRQADCRRLIDRDEKLLVTGATSPGKSWLACAGPQGLP
ncbi:ATP-binding protein [Mesorhizobium sp.]|uniref:ATP-binding protein n=1 Tax=Mesorhizobium sp. TaxID=1871066 RepID=UPI0025C625B7|nr:ATP-binding protein [Mesorhizobium sp.]